MSGLESKYPDFPRELEYLGIINICLRHEIPFSSHPFLRFPETRKGGLRPLSLAAQLALPTEAGALWGCGKWMESGDFWEN